MSGREVAVVEHVDVSTGEMLEIARPRAMSFAEVLDTLANPQAMERQQKLVAAYDAAVRALVGPNDVQVEGRREFKKKSAWRKLGRAFGISTEIVRDEAAWDAEGHLVAKVVVRATAPWGQSAEAIGLCSTRERQFASPGARAKADHDCAATAQTRAANRAISDLIAAGEVSAEEIDGGEHHERQPARRGNGATRPEQAQQPAPAPAAQSAPADDGEVPSCPKCGGAMWDNRGRKRNPKAPDFKCRDKACAGLYWPGQWPPAEQPAATPTGEPWPTDDAGPARPDDDLPF